MTALRRSRLALAIGLAVCPLVSNAIGLGQAHSDSYLNRPLLLSFPLLTEEPELSHLKVSVANPQVHARLGITSPRWLPPLDYQVLKNGEQFSLLVTSKQPIKEPVVNFVLSINYQGMVLYKEVTLLLDFPIESVSNSASQIKELTSTSIKSKPDSKPDSKLFSNNYSKTQARTEIRSRSASVKPQKISSKNYRTRSGDNLWLIANRWQSPNLNQAQKMELILKNNQHAFVKGEAGKLRLGMELKMPLPLNPQKVEAQNKQDNQNPKLDNSTSQLASASIKNTLGLKTTSVKDNAKELAAPISNSRLMQLQERSQIEAETLSRLIAENQQLKRELLLVQKQIQARLIEKDQQIAIVPKSTVQGNIETPMPSFDSKSISESGLFSRTTFLLSLAGLFLISLFVMTGRKLANRWRLNRFKSRLEKQIDHITFDESRRFTEMPQITELDMPQQSSKRSQIQCIQSAADFYLRCERFDLAKELVNESLVRYASDSKMVEKLLRLRKSIYLRIDEQVQSKIVSKLEHPRIDKASNQDMIDLLFEEDKISLVDDEFGRLWNKKAS